MLKTFQLETVTCPSCIAKIENMLKRLMGLIKRRYYLIHQE